MVLGVAAFIIGYFFSRENPPDSLLAPALPVRSLSVLQVNGTFVCGHLTDQEMSLHFTIDTAEGFINMTYQSHARHQSSATTMLFVEKETNLMRAWQPQHDLALMNGSDWSIRNVAAPNLFALPLSDLSAESIGLEKCSEGDDAWE